MSWKTNLQFGKEIILSTSSKVGKPNAGIVISRGIVDEKLLVADCQMDTTLKNLKENNLICVIAGYYRIKGKARILRSGKYFDICVKKEKDYKVKNAILIDIKEVFDLDKLKVIK